MKQLFDNDGLLYSYDKYGVPVSHREYNTVVNALPAGIISSSRCSSDIYDSITTASYSITVDGISVFDKNFNNTFIRNSLSPRTVAPVKYKWTEQTLDGETWNAVFALSYKYVLPNKIKEFLFKIIHRYYQVNSVIYRYIPTINDNMVETLEYLFFIVFMSLSSGPS